MIRSGKCFGRLRTLQDHAIITIITIVYVLANVICARQNQQQFQSLRFGAADSAPRIKKPPDFETRAADLFVEA